MYYVICVPLVLALLRVLYEFADPGYKRALKKAANPHDYSYQSCTAGCRTCNVSANFNKIFGEIEPLTPKSEIDV